MHRPTLTIFEGHDCSGKTTLARQYASLTGAEYIHFGPCEEYESNNLAAIYLSGMEVLFTKNRSVVFDRSWISEPIYARFWRQAPSRLLDVTLNNLEEIAKVFSGVVIVCTVTGSDRYKRLVQKRGDEHIPDFKILDAVREEYRRLSTSKPFSPLTSLPIITCTPLDPGELSTLGDICKELTKFRGSN